MVFCQSKPTKASDLPKDWSEFENGRILREVVVARIAWRNAKSDAQIVFHVCKNLAEFCLFVQLT